MITLTMSFNRIRTILLWLCNVSPVHVALVYDPNYGIYWVARREPDRLPVILAMRHGSFRINIVPPVAVTAMSFLADAFRMLIPNVPDNHDLIVTMDPVGNVYRFDLQSRRDGVRFNSLTGLRMDHLNVDYGILLNQLQHLLHQQGPTVTRNMIGDIIVPHSLETRTSIAFIFCGRVTIIYGTGRMRIFQNPAPVAPEQPCICFLLSLYRDHVPDYRFECFSWIFHPTFPAVGLIRVRNNIHIYLLLQWDSFVRPEVRLIGIY